LIYCDPPYNNTQQYKDKFKSEPFWQWCRDKVKEGHTVFISEYSAPQDFKCIWEKKIINNLNNKNNIERLFKYDM
jgi:DNA adenine methylase